MTPALAAPLDWLVAGGSDAAGLKFYVATLTFHRARQLKLGARPRMQSNGHTTNRVALLEVMAGLVEQQDPVATSPGLLEPSPQETGAPEPG